MDYAIELKSIVKTYYSNNNQIFHAIDNLTLNIGKGEIVGFLGPNGAGKTTTIKILCNLINATSGEIKLNGFDIKKDRNNAMKQVGVVLEGSRNLFWQITPQQNLIYFGRLKGINKNILNNQIDKLLTELDLLKVKNEIVNKLSRGDQQKLSIACALISNPEIIILDEPTLGLDLESSRNLKDWIKTLSKEENKTIILTTNQLDIAQQICNRIIFMNKGKLVADKNILEFLELFKEEYYKIIISYNNLYNCQETLKALLPNMDIQRNENEIILTGIISSQEELYNKISVIYSNHLQILSINKIKYNLEDIFMLLSKK